MFNKFNVVQWSPVPRKPGRTWEVVQVWNEEPKQLLLTDRDACDARVYVALQADCILVDKGEEREVTFKRRDSTTTVKPVPPQANDQN